MEGGNSKEKEEQQNSRILRGLKGPDILDFQGIFHHHKEISFVSFILCHASGFLPAGILVSVAYEGGKGFPDIQGFQGILHHIVCLSYPMGK